MITDQSTCNTAANFLVDVNSVYDGWDVTSSVHLVFEPGNIYTAGCYWNNGGNRLWFNPYGVEAQCTGPQDCRTLCIQEGIELSGNR